MKKCGQPFPSANFFQKSGHTYLNGIPKKQSHLSQWNSKKVAAPFQMVIYLYQKVANIGFTFHKGQCAGWSYLSKMENLTKWADFSGDQPD